MSHFRGLLTPAEALYHVFAKPRPRIPSRNVAERFRETTYITRRSYLPNAKFLPGGGIDAEKPKAPVNASKVVKNEDIPTRFVKVVGLSGTISPSHSRDWIIRMLKSRDQLRHNGLDVHCADNNGDAVAEDDELVLVQVGERSDHSICKIMENRILIRKRFEDRKREKEAAKAARSSAPKELEINWAVSSNDLNTKLKQLEGFISTGKKVTVVLASKRRQRKASPEEAQKVLDSIRERLVEIGARETKPMEGKLLTTATIFVEKNK